MLHHCGNYCTTSFIIWTSGLYQIQVVTTRVLSSPMEKWISGLIWIILKLYFVERSCITSFTIWSCPDYTRNKLYHHEFHHVDARVTAVHSLLLTQSIRWELILCDLNYWRIPTNQNILSFMFHFVCCQEEDLIRWLPVKAPVSCLAMCLPQK